MTIIVCVGVVVLALAAYVIFAKPWRTRPKRAQKWEKAQIMKQLLELSDRENQVSAIAAPAKARTPAKDQGRQPGKPNQKSRGKLAQAARVGK